MRTTERIDTATNQVVTQHEYRQLPTVEDAFGTHTVGRVYNVNLHGVEVARVGIEALKRAMPEVDWARVPVEGRRALKSGGAPPMLGSEDEEMRAHDELHETIEQAIATHHEWRKRFTLFLGGRVDLDAPTVARKDHCAFGRWLRQGGRGALGARFFVIDQLHAEFHRQAASVVSAKKSGNVAAAVSAIDSGGEFAAAYTRLTAALQRLR